MIAQAAAKNKFLEFEDGLVLAYEKDYAMLQGYVGHSYAPNSGIRVRITDYTDKNDTKQASVLVPCYVFDKIDDVCKKNTGKYFIKGGDICDIESTNKSVKRMIANLLQGAQSAISDAYNKKQELLYGMGVAVKSAKLKLTGKSDDGNPDPNVPKIAHLEVPVSCDYQYNQTRVQGEYPDANGFVKCSTLSISRATYGTSADGKEQERKLPWNVKITTFKAKPKRFDNGTVAYDSKTVTDQLELQVSISDDEMSRCMFAVQHFISQWERASLGSFISGMEKRRQQMIANKK